MSNLFLFPIAHAGVVADATPISVVLARMLDDVLTIAGTICILAIVISGILYLVSAKTGDERLQGVAKKGFAASVVGAVMIVGSLVLMRTIAHFLQ